MELSEQLKKFTTGEFDIKLLDEFIRFMTYSYEQFKNVIIIADKIERNSDEYKTLSKYHVAAWNRVEYHDLYKKAVKEAEETDNFFEKEES